MTIYHWILLIAFCIFVITSFSVAVNILFLKRKEVFAKERGSAGSGILYSFTSGMSPFKKESAYLHLPTYLAGMLFHIGTFLSFFLLILFFFNIQIIEWFGFLCITVLFASGISGISVLIKRILSPELRNLSSPDDYFSNLLVTGFQALIIISLLNISTLPALMIYSSILILYIPIGKLQHTIFFFTSRINLGLYFGKRGVWTSKNKNDE